MDKGKKKILRVFTTTSFEGVTSIAILEELLKNTDEIQLDVRYVKNLDFRDYADFADADIVLALGTPYRGYNLPTEFFLNLDVPFMDFLHFSTWGEELGGEHITSQVNENEDPIKQLAMFISRFPESSLLAKYIEFTEKAWYLIEAVNAYRTWSWENNSITRMLLALYHASYKWLPLLMRGLSIEETIRKHAPIIQGQMEKMKDYIDRKKETVKSFNVEVDGQQCKLFVAYADEYINELANDILTTEQTAMPTIVCVGRSTKSSDLFSIRTTKVEAGKVAWLINEGSGKDSVANVFTGVSYAQLMGTGIAQKLAQLEA